MDVQSTEGAKLLLSDAQRPRHRLRLRGRETPPPGGAHRRGKERGGE